ncbi:MAG: hypothetical protein M0P64_03020 [Candidatus Pacebacteria bacterium]|jgi:hypothetical protein|nr:hypothetical protein [Candidatus Paceibacterota bacterium]
MIKFPRAEFWDIFGVGVFAAITLLSGWAITTGEPIPTWGLAFLFFVGIFGIFVDGTIVNKTFLRKK